MIDPETPQKCGVLVLPFDPVPASRPRVTRWGTYHLPKYKQWLADANAFLATATWRAPDGHLEVTIESVFTRAKTSKLTTPNCDVDNTAKAALDALTHAGFWADDKWVVTLVSHKRFAEPGEEAHTKIIVAQQVDKGLFNRIADLVLKVIRACA